LGTVPAVATWSWQNPSAHTEIMHGSLVKVHSTSAAQGDPVFT
jgi:hypothetical protein